MSSYLLTVSAQCDLEEIWSYVAGDNVQAADLLESEVFRACQLIADQPQLGTSRPLWTNLPVKFWVVRKNYFIVFKPDSDPIQILRILHAARDIPALLG